MPTRRDLMLAGGASLFGSLLQPAKLLASAEGEVAAPAVTTAALKHPGDDELIHQLLHFRQQVISLRPADEKTKGISIPYATYPLNIYMRSPAYLKDKVQPPDMSRLRKQLMTFGNTPGAHVSIDYITKGLWRAIAPKHWRVVNECTMVAPGMDRMMADRVITPRYVIDTAELDDLRFALMLITPVDDIINEIVDKLQTCMQHCQHKWSHVPASKWVGYFEHTLPDTWVEREAYMFEMFTYITANGFLVDRTKHPRFAATAPFGTLSTHQLTLPAPK